MSAFSGYIRSMRECRTSLMLQTRDKPIHSLFFQHNADTTTPIKHFLKYRTVSDMCKHTHTHTDTHISVWFVYPHKVYIQLCVCVLIINNTKTCYYNYTVCKSDIRSDLKMLIITQNSIIISKHMHALSFTRLGGILWDIPNLNLPISYLV